MSVNISLHGKVGSNALDGFLCDNWLDVCSTDVSIGIPLYIIIIRSKKRLYVTRNARGKRATDHAEPHGLHMLHYPSCLKKIGDQHIGVFMAICWTQSHA